MTWMEAFAIFMPVSATHFSYCWKDLCRYQLLILCTYQQFGNYVWLAYDRAFCEHAVATNLLDQSGMNMQLFNFYAASAPTRGQLDSWSRTAELSRLTRSQIICKSWNGGRCSAPNVSCHFAHRCSSCSGPCHATHSQVWPLLHPGRQQSIDGLLLHPLLQAASLSVV